MSGADGAALIAGLDPGRSKCGLVLADRRTESILEAAILPPAASRSLLQRWQQRGLGRIVLGNGTGSATWQVVLRELALEPILVDERGSTLAARERYWELFPVRGWRRWLPAGLRLPPRDIDDVVAQLLLERHGGQRLQRSTKAVQQSKAVQRSKAVRSGPAR